jgi:hypothetical protein
VPAWIALLHVVDRVGSSQLGLSIAASRIAGALVVPTAWLMLEAAI